MSKTSYHFRDPDKTPWTERIIYNFIGAADLLGVAFKCKDCEACKAAINRLRKAEEKVREDDNQMD